MITDGERAGAGAGPGGGEDGGVAAARPRATHGGAPRRAAPAGASSEDGGGMGKGGGGDREDGCGEGAMRAARVWPGQRVLCAIADAQIQPHRQKPGLRRVLPAQRHPE